MGDASTLGSTFRGTDQAGLIVAIALHAALVAVLVLQVQMGGDPRALSQGSMTVNLATEVSLESTAPDPVAVARAASAPRRGESAPIVEADRAPDPTRVDETPERTARPTDRATQRPKKLSKSKKRERNDSGSNRFDEAFSDGPGDSDTSDSGLIPADEIGPSATASLQRELDRQIEPKWSGMVPQGVDAEKLVSLVSFRLNQDGSLRGKPTCRTKPGTITASNRPQASTHCERAIRAIQLASPFNLPAKLYNGWKTVRNWEMYK